MCERYGASLKKLASSAIFEYLSQESDIRLVRSASHHLLPPSLSHSSAYVQKEIKNQHDPSMTTGLAFHQL